MSKKATAKKAKEKVLEDILFSCRDSLRGRAALTDKRDMLLTLVFLKFISERYLDRCDKIREENADAPEYAEMLLSQKRTAFGEKGVFMLTPETDWELLKLIAPKGLAVALDGATLKLMESDLNSKTRYPLPYLSTPAPRATLSSRLWFNEMYDARVRSIKLTYGYVTSVI